MAVPPSDERREILQPSLLPVPGHTGAGEETTSDQYCVSNGVRDGAGLAVINDVTSIITSPVKFLWAAQTKKRIAYKLMKLNACSWSCMQAHGRACKLM